MTPLFDAVVHAPNRLQICAMLAPVDEVEFAAVRDTLAVSDSVVSKHLAVLEDAGYVTLRKDKLGARQHTWVSMTKAGRRAFEGHLAELQRLVAAARLPR